MGRVEAEHQTVEKPAAPPGTFDEQPVHLRGQPRQGDVLGKGDLAPDGMAVDPDKPPLRCAFGCHIAAGADIDRAEWGFNAGGDRPADSLARLGRAADPLDIGQLGAAQATAGRQEADGFQQVGLAGTVRSRQHDGTRVGVQPRALVAAETRQRETRHRQLRSRTLIRPDSFFCPGISSGRIAQRHRNSSPTRDMARQGPYRRDHASRVAALSQRFGNSARQTRIGIRTYRAEGSATSRTIVGDAASAMVNRAPSPSIC